MEYTIYFGDKPLVITDKEPNSLGSGNIAKTESLEAAALKQLVWEIEKPEVDAAYLVYPQPEQALEALKDNFNFIVAAGGLVVSHKGNVLLIFRKGKWDLPKGKLDEGEDLEACAVREVEEETGLKGIELKSLVCRTFHTYYQGGVHCLKESVWYQMSAPEQEQLQPQTEEDIERAIWVHPADIGQYLENTHWSVADVLKWGLRSL